MNTNRKTQPRGRLEHTQTALKLALENGLHPLSEENFKQAFPTLAQKSPTACQKLAEQTKIQIIQNIQSAFDELVKETNLPEKFETLDEFHDEKVQKEHFNDLSRMVNFELPHMSSDTPQAQITEHRIRIKKQKLELLQQSLKELKKSNQPLEESIQEKNQKRRMLVEEIQTHSKLL